MAERLVDNPLHVWRLQRCEPLVEVRLGEPVHNGSPYDLWIFPGEGGQQELLALTCAAGGETVEQHIAGLDGEVPRLVVVAVLPAMARRFARVGVLFRPPVFCLPQSCFINFDFKNPC